ncbi:MAG TPA: GNAT family N-acetyltransferase [Longimicrobium sp.]|nr:GNAT family N-acetyltransferase [Longimicrobium sp.]
MRALALRLPDVPRWVEARDLLLHGDGEVTGLAETPELSFVVRDPETGFVAVVGTPDEGAVRAAARPDAPGAVVVAAPEEGARLARLLPGWRGTRARLHLLGDSPTLPDPAPGQAGFLDPAALDTLPLPDELRWELRIAARHSPIAATLAGGRPVSFCYAGAITESLWDVSIDTLPGHRRHGYAALCVAHMIRHMRGQGKQPVWGAVEENPASWRLAAKLGFVPVDELALFEPRE